VLTPAEEPGAVGGDVGDGVTGPTGATGGTPDATTERLADDNDGRQDRG
jgi:hypothetical protein